MWKTNRHPTSVGIVRRLEMPRYLRIRNVVKTERTGAHEHIKAICGLTPDGTHWTLTHEDAVAQVENGICGFYIERPRDKRYDVIVAMDIYAHKYLKTVADRDQPDQLLFLPACPHPVHAPSYAPAQRAVGPKLREWFCKDRQAHSSSVPTAAHGATTG